MSLTKTRAESTTDRPASIPPRVVGAVSAVLLAVGLFLTVASVNAPHEASDARLLDWWQQSDNRLGGMVSGFAALGVAVFFAVVSNHFRSLRASAQSPLWLAFAHSMAGAVTAVWLVTGAAHAVIGHHVDVMNEPLPGVDTLRLVMAFNYVLLDVSGMAVLALAILGTSVVVLRTGALGRWVGYVGFACAVVILGAVVVQLGAYATPIAILWSLSLAVAIWQQPEELGAAD